MDGIMYTLNNVDRHGVCAFACNQRDEVRDLGDKVTAIQAQPGMKQQTFLAVFDTRGNGDGRVAPTVTGDHENRVTDYTAVVVANAFGVVSKGNGEAWLTPNKHTSLCFGGGQAGQGYPCVLLLLNDQGGSSINTEDGRTSPTIRAQMKHHEPTILAVRERCGCEGGGKGCLVQENVAGAIACHNDQFLCYLVNSTVGAVCATDYKGIRNQDIDQEKYVCYAVDMGGGKTACGVYDNQSPTLTCTHGGEPVTLYLTPVEIILRRLTPTECARLQGMPDWWCDDVPHSDSAEYKMWGNGMALPCVMYVMDGVEKCLRKEPNNASD